MERSLIRKISDAAILAVTALAVTAAARNVFAADVSWILVFLVAGIFGIIGFFGGRPAFLSWPGRSRQGSNVRPRRPGEPVILRDERNDADTRYLWAYCDTEGNLHVDGRDTGPGTAIVSQSGEYEWYKEIAVADLPRLRQLLGAPEDANILDVLANFTVSGATSSNDCFGRARSPSSFSQSVHQRG